LLGNRVDVIRKLALQPNVEDLVEKHAPKAPFSVPEVLRQRKALILQYEQHRQEGEDVEAKRSIAFLVGVSHTHIFHTISSSSSAAVAS
jgi:hypothetical protein